MSRQFDAVVVGGVPYSTLQRSVGIHPTVSELIPTRLGELRPGLRAST